jgi:hypothetical protein
MDYGKGRHRVWLDEIGASQGRMILVGGGKSHIGSVVFAQPRQSRSGRGISCTSQVLNASGHKDEVIARLFAEEICVATCEPVVCSVGIHVDSASSDDITKLCENAVMLLGKYLCNLPKRKRKS